MSERLLAGIGCLAAAVACFAAMDVSTQAIVAIVPAAMMIFFRNCMQVLLAGATVAARGGAARWWPRRPWMQVLRGTLLLGCSLTAFLSLQVMPVAEFTAIVLLTPLALTALAAWRGKKPVTWMQWLLVIGAGAGAFLIVKPEHRALGGATLLAPAIVIVNTGYQWVTSQLARDEDAGTMQLWSGLTGATLTGVSLPWFWQSLQGWIWGVLAMLGVLGTVAHGFIIHAYRHAPVAVLTPYLYFQIAFATLGGWLVFTQVPDARATLGMALIAACGAAGTWLAARLQRRSSAAG